MAQTATDVPSDAQPADALAPLRIPIFRAIWIASAISNLGGLIQSVGASWMMTSIGSVNLVALVQASVTLPIMMLSLIAGAVADSLDRRKVMLVAQLFMCCVSLALAVCAWFGWLSPWLLLTFTFMIGCGTAFNAPAWQASVGDMVPRPLLAGAVALNGMAFNVARSVGPAIGGAIVAAFGAAATFTINAFTYIALIAVLARWRTHAPTGYVLPRESLGNAIASGIRYVAMSPAIRTILFRGAIFGIGAAAVSSLMPLVAKYLLTGGPVTYGTLLCAFGVGAVTGGMNIARLKRTVTTESIIRWTSIVLALATAGVAFSRSLPLTMLAVVVAGAVWVIALSVLNVAVQLAAPRWVVARALSLYQMFTFGGMAGGSWLWGHLTERHSVSFALLGAASVLLVSALAGFWHRLAQAEEVDLSPVRNFAAPETAVPVEARSGPIVITVEYVIREADIAEFLSAMNQRRRIRRRDGARNWMLLRDLSDPEVWIERFTTPTWLAYIRHNNRLTQEDAAVLAHLVGLHRGPGQPVVRRMLERQTDALHSGPETEDELATPLTDPTRSS